MNRILIVKLWALGDIVMATPLIPTLQRQFPGVEIDWVADATHAEILQGHPGIKHLEPLATGSWRAKLRRGDLIGWLGEALRIHRKLSNRQYDAVINCHPDKSWTRFLCPAPVRIGLYSTANASANPLFYTRSVLRPKSPPIHNTDHYLLAAQALGCTTMVRTMSIGRMQNEAEFLDVFLRDHSISREEPIVVIAPRTTAENRCWEPERYAELADCLIVEYSAQIILTCSPREAQLARQIIQMAHQPITLSVDTSLQQYAAMLRCSSLVISGDTSAMHIAAAVSTPYLALFGPTPVAERAPVVGNGKALFQPLACAPCDLPNCINPNFRECMKLHTVPDVLDAARHLLELSPERAKKAPAASPQGLPE